MNRLPLILSTICFLLGFTVTLATLKTRHIRPRGLNLVMMAAGFLLQTLFLINRGRAIGHCPLTNLFEVLVFLCWSIALFYFLIGPTFRISLLGMFTEPLLFLIQTVALLAPIDNPHLVSHKHTPWIELHSAIAVIAFGAFAMAAVAGVMYLAQERQLKSHRLGLLFFQMPPITALATVNLRLLWVGLALLTLGLSFTPAIHAAVTSGVVILSLAIWGCYLLLLLGRKMGPRRVALFSVLIFAAAVIALCASGHFTAKTKPASIEQKGRSL